MADANPNGYLYAVRTMIGAVFGFLRRAFWSTAHDELPEETNGSQRQLTGREEEEDSSAEADDNNRYSPLILAASEGKHSVVAELLCRKADVNGTDNDGASALHVAAQLGLTDIMETLLQNGANASLQTRGDLITPLYLAAQENYVDAIAVLVEHGATDLDHTCRGGSTPLYIAAQSGHNEAIEVLLAHKADPNCESRIGSTVWTPIHVAISCGHLQTAQLLSNAGAGILSPGSVGVFEDAEEVEGDRLDPAFAPTDADYTPRDPLPSHHLDSDSDSEPDSSPSLHPDPKPHPGADSASAHTLTADELENDSSANLGFPGLVLAAAEGSYARVLELLSLGHDANDTGPDGAAALHVACQLGLLSIVEALLQARADPCQQSSDAITPLYLAAQENLSAAMRVLLRSGAMADINRPTGDGVTPLYIAAQNGYNEAVLVLLAHKADPNCENRIGSTVWTPIHVAADRGHLETVQLLSAAGANLCTPEEKDTTESDVTDSDHDPKQFDDAETKE